MAPSSGICCLGRIIRRQQGTQKLERLLTITWSERRIGRKKRLRTNMGSKQCTGGNPPSLSPTPPPQRMSRITVDDKQVAFHVSGRWHNSRYPLSRLYAWWFTDRNTTMPDMRVLAGNAENTVSCTQVPCPTFTHPLGDGGAVEVEKAD